MPRAGLHCKALDATPAPPVRVAVTFFGLVRRIEHTLDAIETNLLGPVRRAVTSQSGDNAVDVFIHALLTQRVNSSNRFHAYAAEANVVLGEADFLALKPCRYAAEDQRVVDMDMQTKERVAVTSAWRRSHERRLKLKRYTDSMLTNVYRAYYSLRQVHKLVIVQETSRRMIYTHVIAARPDCTLLSPLAWSPPPEGVVIVPNFAHNSGINDRFAFGCRKAMAAYMRRLDWLLASSQDRAVDALGNATETENLVCRHLVESRLFVGVTPLCVVRVRATGIAVIEALNKSKSPLGLPWLCARRVGLSLSTSADDQKWPCPEELRETHNGVTSFRSDIWLQRRQKRKIKSRLRDSRGI